jgi:hypothetical protein
MNIPKSLHTVSAIVAVARAFYSHETPRIAALCAAEILGYPVDATDIYGLIARAADTLKKGGAA